MARNAAVALGNSRAPAVLPELRALTAAELAPVVKEHLQWAVARLEGGMQNDAAT
jgi:epoxyqueuosine reductase QueG